MNSDSPYDVDRTFLHLKNDGSTTAIPVSDSFWEELADGRFPQLEQGRLFSAHTFSEPWPVWERHPAGEEVVFLLSGSVDLVLEENGQRRTLRLTRRGEYVLVPRGVWHTAIASEPVTMIFITPGAGTEHRPA